MHVNLFHDMLHNTLPTSFLSAFNLLSIQFQCNTSDLYRRCAHLRYAIIPICISLVIYNKIWGMILLITKVLNVLWFIDIDLSSYIIAFVRLDLWFLPQSRIDNTNYRAKTCLCTRLQHDRNNWFMHHYSNQSKINSI